MTGQKTIIWDFDGTLVQFTSWRYALIDVLNEFEPGHDIDHEQLRPFLRSGFPWHKPEEPHFHLSTPEAWWDSLEPFFTRVYQSVGFNMERAALLARQVRKQMTNPKRFILFEDTIPVLTELKKNGWRNVILSNHMPELPDIVRSLELTPLIEFCLTSGVTGYEKPNPQAFHMALSLAGDPKNVWMAGDNPISDVKGAEIQGIPAILVRGQKNEEAKYKAKDLWEVIKIIEEQ
ncbi:MAG: HAD family hydrolase [Dehalococcoidales bacterium]|nr:HAD family hydrolase [Dehalococcoidales bacterium]